MFLKGIESKPIEDLLEVPFDLFIVPVDRYRDFMLTLEAGFGSEIEQGDYVPYVHVIDKVSIDKYQLQQAELPSLSMDVSHISAKEFGQIHANEIHLSKNEIYWADQWLLDNGLKEGEKVAVMLHGASSSEKLMPILEYTKMLRTFSKVEDLKILIFDEKGSEKHLLFECC